MRVIAGPAGLVLESLEHDIIFLLNCWLALLLALFEVRTAEVGKNRNSLAKHRFESSPNRWQVVE